jgi:hypothetical protein
LSPFSELADKLVAQHELGYIMLGDKLVAHLVPN